MPWEEEAIPDEDTLFRAVPVAHAPDGQLIPAAFRLEPDERDGLALSADWARYSTASECKERREGKAVAGVMAWIVGSVRGVASLQVSHRPLDDNRSHSHVHCPADADKALRTEMRNRLHEMAIWAIPPPTEASSA